MYEFHMCRVHIVFSKKKSTWRSYVGHCNVNLNSMYGCDCMWWFACITTKSLDGNSYVPNLNWNGDKRNLNRNRFGNEWNENYRFLAVRK